MTEPLKSVILYWELPNMNKESYKHREEIK